MSWKMATKGKWNRPAFEAATVGAKHRRERIFFVAHTDSPRLPGSEQPGELRAQAEGRITPEPERSSSSYASNQPAKKKSARPDINTLLMFEENTQGNSFLPSLTLSLKEDEPILPVFFRWCYPVFDRGYSRRFHGIAVLSERIKGGRPCLNGHRANGAG